jgi:hypothetical protein
LKTLLLLCLLPLTAFAQTQTCTTPAGTFTFAPAAVVTPPPPSNAFWVYHNGVMSWGGDYSFGGVAINYEDTQGRPLSGPFDISVSLHGQWGGFLPFAGGTVPLWAFDDSPYTYLTFAFKPTRANQTAQVFFVKVGDIPVGIVVNPFKYGPAPIPGVWGTYKIPLKDLGVLRTKVYKFAVQDQTGSSDNVFYLDDIGFVN